MGDDVRIDRNELQNHMLSSMALTLNVEQYNAFAHFFDKLTDSELFEFYEFSKSIEQKPSSAKEYLNILHKFRELNRTTAKNTALIKEPLIFMREEDNNRLLTKISTSSPSDIIHIARESDKKLIDLWEHGDVPAGGVMIPSDLFFSGTIPLMDCRIIIDERGTRDNGIEGVVVEYRVVIFNDFLEKVRECDEDKVILVGAVINTFPDGAELIFPIRIVYGFGYVLGGAAGYRNMTQKAREYASAHSSQYESGAMLVGFLETWYGIQIALLHPTVRDVFKRPKTEAITLIKKSSSKNKRRNKVKYFKRHIIDSDELDAIMYGEPSKNSGRKCHALVWYVIGHWRTYKDGKKVFISPYWKGALREIKICVPARERVIEQAVSGVLHEKYE